MYNPNVAADPPPDNAPDERIDTGKSGPTAVASPFSRLVDDCVAAGLLKAVLPIIPPNAATAANLLNNRGKIPGQYLGNLWCGLTGWTKHVTTPADVARWRLWPDAGLCIRTAVLPALDIDVEAPELAATLAALVRSRIGQGALVRTRGSSPRLAFLFRVEGVVRKRRFAFQFPGDDEIHAVDLLGDGQQLVLAGRHPSGMAYGIEAPGLSGKSLSDIPILNPAQLDELWEEIQAIIAAAGGQIIQNNATTNYAQQDRKLDPAQTVMREIVRRRACWVPPLLGWGPGKAEDPWRISGAELGRDDMQEDLAIYPDGIRDFGTERSHDPISLIREFGAVGADGEIEFGGSPEYGARDGQPYAVVGEWDNSVRRPSEGEALAWLSRQLGGPAIQQGAVRASAMPALAEAVSLDWEKLEITIAERWFEADPDVSEIPSLPEGGASSPKPPKLQLLSFDDVAATALTISAHPLVDDLLDQRAMTVLYGESNTGKTFVAMDLAYHVASGLPWGGMRTEQHAVVYIAAEGGAGARKRAAALRSKYGPCQGFLYLLSPVNLLDPNADLGPLIDLLKGVDRLGLIVLDTLSRVLAGGDENSSIDMGALVRHFDAIRAATAAHLLVVHHTGKKLERGARGHSLLRAATDTEIEISEGKIRVTKQRDMEKFSEAAFGLETVVLGQNERGKDITSCTVGLLARGSVEAGELTDREAEVLRAVTVVLARAVAPAKGVRSAAIASELGEAGDDGANRVRGHLNKLVSKNRLVKLDRGLWLPRDIHAATYFEAIDPPEETPKNLGKTLATEAPQNSRPQTTLLDPSGGVFA